MRNVTIRRFNPYTEGCTICGGGRNGSGLMNEYKAMFNPCRYCGKENDPSIITIHSDRRDIHYRCTACGYEHTMKHIIDESWERREARKKRRKADRERVYGG